MLEEIFAKSEPFQATTHLSPFASAMPVVLTPLSVTANPPVVLLLTM
jgi:hypothetical protein